jgi:hypothetical protein
MRSLTTFTVISILAMGFAGSALALDDPHDAKVDVFVALTVAETVEMDFGAVIDADGTVTLDLLDTIAADPNNIHQGGTVASGVFTFTGSATQAVDIDLTAANANGLLLSNFTTDLGGGVFPLVAETFDGAGNLVMTVGGDLEVQSGVATEGENQSLNFTVTINYN